MINDPLLWHAYLSCTNNELFDLGPESTDHCSLHCGLLESDQIHQSPKERPDGHAEVAA